MLSSFGSSLAFLLTLHAAHVYSASIPLSERTVVKKTKGSYPFNQLVAFGDQLMDNGGGSYAHGLDPNNIYGNETWTDGPVVPTYLADLLDMPLLDFAWGGAYGGGLAGATIDNSYTPAKDSYKGNPVPSTHDQITNYTSGTASKNIKNALQVIWVGQNDIKKHTNWYANPISNCNATAKPNVAFYHNFTSLLLNQVETLIEAGAPAVMYMNIYPIQLAPITTTFLCHGNAQCATNWGTVVDAANDYTKTQLAASKYHKKIIYYDVNSYMQSIMNDKETYGYTQPLNFLCDSGNKTDPTNHFTECAQSPKWTFARPFFWFTNDQPETSMHNYIAQDMKKTIDSFYGVS